MYQVTLKDGTIIEAAEGKRVIDIAYQISEGLARNAAAAVVDGKTVDLRYPITKDINLDIKTFDSEEGKHAFWHTSSHIMALAVTRLYPGVQLAIGPAIDDGFYYDFDKENSFTEEDLLKIEAEMKKIVKEGHELKTYTLPRAEALEKVKADPYKVELINDLPEDAVISFYELAEFTDLCAGPHLMNVKPVKAVKLLQVAGAYWRGSEKNKMLTRIYGVTFPKAKELEDHLHMLEEAKKRDHIKLGRELGIFTQAEEIGQGLPLFKPKGAKILQLLQRWVEDEEEKRGYVITKTPFFSKPELYKISGHWDHYRSGMFHMGNLEDESTVLSLRPMTCPFQFTIYNSDQHSYRELPIRYAETSTLFRNESSGEMHGLIRVRQFTISEGHLIVRPDQVAEEFKGVMDLQQYILDVLGLSEGITYRFSMGDREDTEKYIDNPKAWEDTEGQMKNILDSLPIEYHSAKGEAAFYGPKLDIQYKNVHGKEDTIITNQIDFALPERFDMYYIDSDGQKKRPYVLHRTSIGCYERTLAMLIEKYAGAFPLWLAPIQVKILPISEKYHAYVEQIEKAMKAQGIRVEADYRGEKIGYKIREARLDRAPYMLIIGEQEEKNQSVAVRSRQKGDEGQFEFNEFMARIQQEITEKYNYHKFMEVEPVQ